MDGGRQAWDADPLLDVLEPPPAAWEVAAPGAVVLAVQTPDGVEPYRWCKAVALAWCRSPATGTFAVLLAWEELRATPENRPKVSPAWSWCRFDPARCAALPAATVPNAWGLGWWGGRLDGAMADAISAAAESLPGHMRARAVRPAAPDEVAQLPALR